MANKKIIDLSAGAISDTQLLFNGDPSTGALSKNTFGDLKSYVGGGSGSGPLTYVAIFSQSGSSNPPYSNFDVTNSTGLTFTWGYSSAGTYTLTASAAFFTGLTVPFFTTNPGAFGFTISYAMTSATVMTIYVRSFAGAFVDSALDHAVIKLEQYV